MKLASVVAFTLLAFSVTADAKTFRFGTTSLPPAKGNPFASTSTTTFVFFATMYDALTQLNNDGKLQPWLATEWRPVDQTTWIFKLRPNVTFSNGEPFDANAVKAVFDFLGSDAAVAQSVGRDVDFISAVRVIDPLTAEFKTKTPNIFLPRYLAAVAMVPPVHFAKVGIEGLALAPVGTGPFKVDQWNPDKVEFSAFTKSWRAPKVERLDVLAVPEATARMQALESGRVDATTNLSPDHVPRLEEQGFRFIRRTPSRQWVIALDTIKQESPFRDVRVRQAVNYAVNRQAIIDVLLGGMTEMASQPATPVAVGYDPNLKPYPYDPAKARALLNEAGFEKGFSFIVEIPLGQLANDAAIVQQIAADLGAVGITMTAQNISFPEATRAMTRGGWKGLALQTDFSSAPPMDIMRAIYRHSCDWTAPWFCDPAIQPKIAEAQAVFDEAKRTALTQEIVRHYRDVASALFLFPIVTLDGVSAKVTGWGPWNDNLMFHQLDLKD